MYFTYELQRKRATDSLRAKLRDSERKLSAAAIGKRKLKKCGWVSQNIEEAGTSLKTVNLAG